MGQVPYGSAVSTHPVRAAIQRSQASRSHLSRELGINPKTVAKWRNRATIEDLKTGPIEPRSTVLTEAEEAAIVAFRRYFPSFSKDKEDGYTDLRGLWPDVARAQFLSIRAGFTLEQLAKHFSTTPSAITAKAGEFGLTEIEKGAAKPKRYDTVVIYNNGQDKSASLA